MIARCGDPPPEDRREINTQITEMLNRCLVWNSLDAFCGYKAYRVSSLKHMHIDEDGYAVPLQAWVMAAAADLRITEGLRST